MKKFSVDKNFCRVFEIPIHFPEGFLFGGPKIIEFKMVDWFNPIPPTDGFFSYDSLKPWEYYEEMLQNFIRNKLYAKKGHKYLIITDFDRSTIVEI